MTPSDQLSQPETVKQFVASHSITAHGAAASNPENGDALLLGDTSLQGSLSTLRFRVLCTLRI